MSMLGYAASRSASVAGLKRLKCPDETGGDRKQYDDFLTMMEDHVGVGWPAGTDVAPVIKGREKPILDLPEELSDEDKKKQVLVDIYNQMVVKYTLRDQELKDNMKALFPLVYMNVTRAMKAKVSSRRGFEKANRTKDIVWLLEAIEDVMTNFDESKSPDLAVDDQLERIMIMRQKEDESNEDFIKAMKREVKTFEKHGGAFMWTPRREDQFEAEMEIAKEEFEKERNGDEMDKTDLADAETEKTRVIKDMILAMVVIKHADKTRYGDLQNEFSNAFLTGTANYPTLTAEALRILDNWIVRDTPSQRAISRATTRSPSPNPRTRPNRNHSVSFLAAGERHKYLASCPANGPFHPRITCHLCGFKGHYKSGCPYRTEDGGRLTEEEGRAAEQEQEVRVVIFRAGILFEQHGIAYINPNWILLDSESSHHLFCNEKYVTNIRETTDGEVLRMHSNGGHLDSRLKANFCSKIEVWFNVNGLANILSLALVSDQFRVTMDTDCENPFIAYISEKHTLKFKRVTEDLYILDASNIDMSKLSTAFNFLTTVDTNKGMFKARDVRKVDEAITLNRRTNHMAKDKFMMAVKNNLIRNCPLTVGDVKRSHLIYGPPLPPIKGRSRYEETPRVNEIIQLPKGLYDDLKDVTLGVDFYYVNGVTVLHSISRRINYRTVMFPLSRSKPSIINEIKKIQQKYHSRGFRIVDLHADNKFDKMEADILPIRLQCCGVDDHVPEVERSIQTQKNEHRSVCHAMPYRCLPRIMIHEIVKQGNEFLNAIGNGDTIGPGLTPRDIIDNLPHIDYPLTRHR